MGVIGFEQAGALSFIGGNEGLREGVGQAKGHKIGGTVGCPMREFGAVAFFNRRSLSGQM